MSDLSKLKALAKLHTKETPTLDQTLRGIIYICMMASVFLLVFGIFMSVKANEPPPVPKGGLTYIAEMECRDAETGETGYCYMMQDVDGNVYSTFWQGDVLMFIRKALPDGTYESIWVNDQFRSI